MALLCFQARSSQGVTTLAVFGISDLHLSFGTDKPMDIFGPHWEGHAAKMAKNWDAMVGPDDFCIEGLFGTTDKAWPQFDPSMVSELEWSVGYSSKV